MPQNVMADPYSWEALLQGCLSDYEFDSDDFEQYGRDRSSNTNGSDYDEITYLQSELHDQDLKKCGTELFVDPKIGLSAIHVTADCEPAESKQNIGLSAIHVTADCEPAESKQNLGYLGLKENPPETQTLWGEYAGCTTKNDTENMLVDVAQIGPTGSKQTRLYLRSTTSPEDKTHYRCQEPAAHLVKDKMYDQSNASTTDVSCAMALPLVVFRDVAWSSHSKRATNSNLAAMDNVLENQPLESLAMVAHTHTVLGASAQAPIVIDGTNDEQEEESSWNPERTECFLPSRRVRKRAKLAEGVRRWTDPQVEELQITKPVLEYYVVDDEDDDDYRPVKRRRISTIDS